MKTQIFAILCFRRLGISRSALVTGKCCFRRQRYFKISYVYVKIPSINFVVRFLVRVQCDSTLKCICEIQTHIFCAFLEEQISANVQHAQGNLDIEMDTSVDKGVLKSIRC